MTAAVMRIWFASISICVRNTHGRIGIRYHERWAGAKCSLDIVWPIEKPAMWSSECRFGSEAYISSAFAKADEINIRMRKEREL